MDRRAFLLFVSTGLAFPASVQAADPLRTVGVLMGLPDDEETKARAAAIKQGLAKRGWVVGRNLKLEFRYAAGDFELMRALAKELVALRPDVIVGHSTPVVSALVEATHTIPIVFVVVADPIGSGFVASLAHPGGNATGFSNPLPTITGKYLSILRELEPRLSRVALMYNPESSPGGGSLFKPSFIQSAKEFRVSPIVAEVHSPAEIEAAMTALGGQPGSALIVMADNYTSAQRPLIIPMAARLRIPTLYPYRYFVDEGGLLSYGVDVLDFFRRAPDYVDRILRGAKPADLPVQMPIKFQLVINLKTARELDIVVPRILLAGADSLIE